MTSIDRETIEDWQVKAEALIDHERAILNALWNQVGHMEETARDLEADVAQADADPAVREAMAATMFRYKARVQAAAMMRGSANQARAAIAAIERAFGRDDEEKS